MAGFEVETRREGPGQLALRLGALFETVVEGLESHLKGLEEMELRSTGSWAVIASAQNEWSSTAIRYLEDCAARLPADERPDPYWADDVVAGIIASARALIGVDELHARTERYSGPMKRVNPEEDEM